MYIATKLIKTVFFEQKIKMLSQDISLDDILL
jgi:hypothetical protein